MRNRDAEWFERTEHCGRCGQPGDFCLCTDRDPCGCRELHRMGSGRAANAIDQFGGRDAGQVGLF